MNMVFMSSRAYKYYMIGRKMSLTIILSLSDKRLINNRSSGKNHTSLIISLNFLSQYLIPVKHPVRFPGIQNGKLYKSECLRNLINSRWNNSEMDWIKLCLLVGSIFASSEGFVIFSSTFEKNVNFYSNSIVSS
jgi:hypothetical protein